MEKNPIVINLKEGIPNILFVGNGISYSPDFSWYSIIEKISEVPKNISKLQNDNGVFQIPNPLLTMALCDSNDKTRREKYIEAMGGYKYNDTYVKKLLEIPFDAILTTNYTYDFENGIIEGYKDYSNKKKSKCSFSTQKDSKFLIHTYNQLNDHLPIWHFHGELRRNSSMILSHDDYARLIGKIIEFNANRKNDYEIKYTALEMKSWIDYFIVANVYFLGYSMDTSEFDVWWLLNRKKRENASVGKVYFYEPEEQRNYYKLEALRMCGVNNISLGYRFNEKNRPYDKFYMDAIDDIKKKVTR